MSAHIWQRRRNKHRFRAFYTLRELADMLQLGKERTRRLLAGKLTPHRIGNRDVYYLSELRDTMPELFESLRLKRELDEESAEFPLAELA